MDVHIKMYITEMIGILIQAKMYSMRFACLMGEKLWSRLLSGPHHMKINVFGEVIYRFVTEFAISTKLPHRTVRVPISASSI